MASKPASVPQWDSTQVNLVEPTGEKTTGIDVGDDAVSSYFNWVLNLLYLWVLYVRDGVFVGEAGAPGLTVTGGTGNQPGILSTGTGSGSGLEGVGGATGVGVKGTSATAGVKGVGTGNGKGGEFTGAGNGEGLTSAASGSGAAVNATSGGTGTALIGNAGAGTGLGAQLTGNATNAPLLLTSQAATPSNGVEGALYADTDHKLYYHNGTTWKEVAFV